MKDDITTLGSSYVHTRVWIGSDMQFLMKLPPKTLKSSLLLCICWSIFSILNNLCRKVIPWINLGADTLDFHVALWASPLLWCWSRNAGSKWIHFPLSLPCWLHSLMVTTAPKWNRYYTLMHTSLWFVHIRIWCILILMNVSLIHVHHMFVNPNQKNHSLVSF